MNNNKSSLTALECSITSLIDLRFYRPSKEIIKAHKWLCAGFHVRARGSIIRLNKPTEYNLPSYIGNQRCKWLLPGVHLNYTYTRYHLIHSANPIVS